MGKAYNSATGLINCKNAVYTNGGGDSPTHWFECKQHKTLTDPAKCAACKDRKPRTGCEAPEFRKFTPPPMPPETTCPMCRKPLQAEYGTFYCNRCRVIIDPLLLKEQEKEV